MGDLAMGMFVRV